MSGTNDLRQFGGGFYTHQFQCCPGAGVNLGCPANDPNCQRHLKAADQVPISILSPCAQARVAAIASCICVSTGFNRAPVIPGGNHDGIHAVHNALVVGGGAVGIDGGESPGCNHTLHNIGTRIPAKCQLINGYCALCARQAVVSQVG